MTYTHVGESTRNVPDTTSAVSLASLVAIWKARPGALGGLSFLAMDPLEASACPFINFGQFLLKCPGSLHSKQTNPRMEQSRARWPCFPHTLQLIGPSWLVVFD